MEMRFPNWFRVFWWILILALLTVFLVFRLSALRAGHATGVDIVLLIFWLSLAVAPLFTSIEVFGVKLKQQVEELRMEFSGLRSEVRTTLEVQNQFAPTVALFPTLSSEQLSDLAQQVQMRAESALGSEARQGTQPETPPHDADFLFRVRYALERELRRLYGRHSALSDENRYVSITRITRSLQEQNIIDRDAAVAADELYRIASRVIHGREVLPQQMKFAYDVSSWLLAELRTIN